MCEIASSDMQTNKQVLRFNLQTYCVRVGYIVHALLEQFFMLERTRGWSLVILIMQLGKLDNIVQRKCVRMPVSKETQCGD